jgi:hypothetical protein
LHYFIDEAGNYRVPDSPAEHRVAVASCLAFTDDGWTRADAAFAQFKKGLRRVEFKSAEPKWHLLSSEHKSEFCRLVASLSGISLTPVTLDLSHLAEPNIDWLQPMLTKLDKEPESMLYEQMRQQIGELAKQAHNLSPVQHLRIYSWAYCLLQALYHSILFLGNGRDQASWKKVRISIDPVQPRAGSREERVFSIMVLAWLMGWSKRQPFLTIEGVHTNDHEFVKLYDTEAGIDLGKLVRPNLHWESSLGSAGIQFADLTAGAVYQAASELKEGSESLRNFATLMRASFYGPRRGPGLFSPLDDPSPRVADKYRPLSDAMKSIQKKP